MAKISVRARVIDLLGRQQIAGIPTAISELFKNAHDAYALNVEVDYFPDTRLLILRDDGLGMTRQEFEQRWLTIGTESKLKDSGIGLPETDPNQPQRLILGEKGIGRLAVASIGSVVLVLSRARRQGSLSDTVAALIHWELFEAPGIDLEDIIIPLREFSGGALPDDTAIQEMAEQIRQNMVNLDKKIPAQIRNNIFHDLNNLSLDIAAFQNELSDYSADMNLKNSSGTHFYVRPVRDVLNADIMPGKNNEASNMERTLLGFTNTMVPSVFRAPITARFRTHKNIGSPEELMGGGAFFTPEEFREADHRIEGAFDERGIFSGIVSVYGRPAVKHKITWPDGDGARTVCGPFSINFAYVHGHASKSLLPNEEHARLSQKLNRMGGLYIYRDGVRILPYGNSDFDFLNIEKRRTLGAAYYFFSYRRMFGAIELTSEQNSEFQEKAGREGFISNAAYRQFRSILENFLQQLAADFFRDHPIYNDARDELKKNRDGNEKIRLRREKQAGVQRRNFQNKIEAAFSDGAKNKLEQETQKIIKEFKEATVRVSKMSDNTEAADTLVNAEAAAALKLRRVEESIKIERPRGVGLSPELMRDWSIHRSEFYKVRNTVILQTRQDIAGEVSNVARQENIKITPVARLESEFGEQMEFFQNSLATYNKNIGNAALKIQELSREFGKISLNNIAASIESAKNKINEISKRKLSESEFVEIRNALENDLSEDFEREQNRLLLMRDRLNALVSILDDDSVLADGDLIEALEEETIALRERNQANIELAQVGMALGIIQHEFERNIKTIRTSINGLKPWADGTPEIAQLYNRLRLSFEHLDGYLSMFTPLNRRIYRKAAPVSGGEIYNFVMELFKERLGRHQITIEATDQFIEHSIILFPSTIYPCFVNLIDNSIFWLKDVRTREKKIVLDAVGGAFFVKDTGPGISDGDEEVIFELGFSRKPLGRGMGLYISRDTLRRIGCVLSLDASDEEYGAVFRIAQVDKASEEMS